MSSRWSAMSGLEGLPAGGEVAGLPEDPGIADGAAGGGDAVDPRLPDHPQGVRGRVDVARSR